MHPSPRKMGLMFQSGEPLQLQAANALAPPAPFSHSTATVTVCPACTLITQVEPPGLVVRLTGPPGGQRHVP
jgi:hypothetical protein